MSNEPFQEEVPQPKSEESPLESFELRSHELRSQSFPAEVHFEKVSTKKSLYACGCGELKQKFQILRLTAALDLFYLTKYVLGYKDINEKHRLICDLVAAQNIIWWKKASSQSSQKRVMVHPCSESVFKTPRITKLRADMQAFKENPIYQRLWLMFRGAFKTTIISKAHTIQAMLIYPDIRILIAHNKLGNAEAILREIKNQFIFNALFRQLYPEYCPKRGPGGKVEWGTTEQVTLPNRSQTLQVQEPTIDTMGVDTMKTGMHYDLHKRDDLVTELSVTNEEQINSSILGDASMQQLFNRPAVGFVDRIGTPYHYADLYQKLQTDEVKKMDHGYWREGAQSVFKLPVHDEAGIYQIPEILNEEGFERIKSSPTMDPYTVNTQYLLKPVNPSNQEFKPDWFRVWHEPVALEGTVAYLKIDPATSKRKKSDYTVILYTQIDGKKIKYTTDGIRDKLNVTERIHAVIRFLKAYPNIIGILYETVGFQETDAVYLREAMRENKCERIIYEIKSPKHSKADRIRRLIAPYSNSSWYWKNQIFYTALHDGKVHNLTEEARYEAYTFPFSEHDDILDCQSQLLDPDIMLAMGYSVKKETKSDKTTYRDIHNMLRREKKVSFRSKEDRTRFWQAKMGIEL